MVVDWDVAIRMDDGVVLRADVFRPADDGRHPVILAYGPYGKGLDFDEGFPGRWKLLVQHHPDVARGSTCRYANFENADPEKWVPDGYVCVRVDSRGIGRSEGYLCPFQPRETRDFYECIEWAAAQPWSNGKVGLSGISYLAMNQWYVASLQPPHLTAMIPWEGAADWYRDCTHHGGIRTTFWDLLYDLIIQRVQHGVGDRGFRNPVTGQTVGGPETLTDEELRGNRCDFAEEIRNHPLADEYHRVRSPDWSKITVPFLSAGNWGGQGLHLRGNVEGFVRAASSQKWLEIHGLEHWTHYYTDYGVSLQRQFFEFYLKGVDNGWARRPPVRLNIRRVDGFVQREEHEWPLARTRWTRLYLDAAELSLSRTPVAAARQTSYAGLGPGVRFMTPPLEQEVEITGPVAARLHISSSTTDADLFLVLQLFDPAGQEVVFSGAQHPRTPISQGWLRASHRRLDPKLSTEYRPYHAHDRVETLVPEQVYPVDVEIWPTCIVAPAGYRLGLSVRGTDYDYEETAQSAANLMVRTTAKEPKRGPGQFLHDDPRDRPPDVFAGTVTLHTGGATDSSLLLPFIPAR
jgi:predicted acyl esterase